MITRLTGHVRPGLPCLCFWLTLAKRLTKKMHKRLAFTWLLVITTGGRWGSADQPAARSLVLFRAQQVFVDPADPSRRPPPVTQQHSLLPAPIPKKLPTWTEQEQESGVRNLALSALRPAEEPLWAMPFTTKPAPPARAATIRRRARYLPKRTRLTSMEQEPSSPSGTTQSRPSSVAAPSNDETSQTPTPAHTSMRQA